MTNIKWIFIILVCFSHQALSQTVAILDQGYNKELKYRGKSKFSWQACASYKDFISNENFYSLRHKGHFRHQISLCPNGQSEQIIGVGGATHPRRNLGLLLAPKYSLSRGFDYYRTTKRLVHGRDVSNALYDFDRNIFQVLYQVYGFDNVNLPDLPLPGSSYNNDKLEQILDHTQGYKSNSGRFIATALARLADFNTGDMGAISISTVVGSRNSTPSICIPPALGQTAVDRLRAKGIAVIAALNNVDTPAGVKSWPNCIRGVINVGNTNTFVSGDGIGIGGNGIDFYISSATQVKEGATTYTQYGNSLSSPKIAGAFALLHKAYPSSTVTQKYRALQRASASKYTYQGVKRRRIKRNQMNNALKELNKIIFPNGILNEPDVDLSIGDVIASQPGRFGPSYEGERSEKVVVNTSFGNSGSSLVAGDINVDANAVIRPSATKDVMVQVTGLMVTASLNNRQFDVYVNGVKAGQLSGFGNNVETTRTVSISRNFFKAGTNRVEVRPINTNINWGVRNIKVALLPTVPLIYGRANTNTYGTIRTPKRHTGIKYEFDVISRADSVISLSAYDIDFSTEIKVFINDQFLGHLPVTPNNQFGKTASFVVTKAQLKSSGNIIELVQRKPDQFFKLESHKRWGVKNMKIEKTLPEIVPVDVALIDKPLKKGEPFRVSASFKNNGVGLAPSSMIEYYLSTDKTISRSNDTLLSQRSIGVMAQGATATVTHQITTDSIGADYFLGVCYRPVATETNKNNNCSEALSLIGDSGLIPILSILLLGGE